MQIIPAIDLKDNKCVRLTKGEDKTSIVFNDDPEKQALYFQEKPILLITFKTYYLI